MQREALTNARKEREMGSPILSAAAASPGSDGNLPIASASPDSDGNLPIASASPGSDGNLPIASASPGSDGNLPIASASPDSAYSSGHQQLKPVSSWPTDND